MKIFKKLLSFLYPEKPEIHQIIDCPACGAKGSILEAGRERICPGCDGTGQIDGALSPKRLKYSQAGFRLIKLLDQAQPCMSCQGLTTRVYEHLSGARYIACNQNCAGALRG